MPHPALLSFALALAYAFTGWLALQVAVPPGYAAPLFPPAGIALSALLIFGARLWPGVFAGSLAVQVLALWQTGTYGFSWITLLAPLGATLQALGGVLLARRLVGFPNALDTPASIVRFLLVVAPASALINASLSVPLLVWSGIVSPGDAFFNWGNWWLGDTLGIMLAAPMVLAFFGEPRESWRPRRTAVGLPLAAAMALTALSFHQIRASDELRIHTQFARDAEHIADQLQRRLDAQLDMIHALERFVALHPALTRERFREFVTPLLARYPGTLNFTWNPYVPGAERERFEAQRGAEDHPGFRILDRADDPRQPTLPARVRDEYLPILFVEPLEGNRTVIGLNPLSIAAASGAIHATLRHGRPVASPGMRLTQETGQQRGVVVYQGLAADGQTAVRGMVSGAFRMDDVVRATLSDLDALAMELCLVDLDGASGSMRLSGAERCERDGWMEAEVSARFPIPFAGRQWELRLRGKPDYAPALRSWGAWASIAIGSTAAGILGAFLLMTTGHARRISSLVQERTAQLAAATAHLSEQRAALARAQRIARMGSWEVAADGRTVQCSEELRILLALPADGPVTLSELGAALIAPDRARLFLAIDELSTQQAGHQALDCRPAHDPQQVMHFLLESEPAAQPPCRVRGTVQDVTRARAAEAHIQHLAHYDALTGLPNRSLWMSRARAALSAAQRHGNPLAVLFLDLDQFKTVNDSLGHPVGDRLLATVAQRLTECIREEDVLARLGGDEFVLLLPRLAHRTDAAVVARKMLEVIGRPIEANGHELTPSVSIGIALSPDDGADLDTLLKHADIAMYGAKEAGRNNFQFFVPEMNARVLERLVVENGLRRAIERNELVLHYQPQVDSDHGTPLGVEALVRWNHPELGLVPPGQFITVAEESGLIGPLGQWVLREACRQQVLWSLAGHDGLQVAVNISALQFRRREFVAMVQDVLAETGADPHCIELEITESALMQPSEELFERLERLVALGLTLALDDFGTGYSSLAYLKRLPITRLKLDRSFVRDLPGDPEDAAIASATLSLARDLGLEVVAEGVENEAQRDYLRERGCRVIQGYLVSRPQPAEVLDDWLARRARRATAS